MNNETAPPDRVPRPTSPTGHFAMRFSSTPRGARLARRLAGQRLDAWGIPYDCDTHHALTLIVAELAANAVLHGRVPGATSTSRWPPTPRPYGSRSPTPAPKAYRS